jgi:hypothetical protein
MHTHGSVAASDTARAKSAARVIFIGKGMAGTEQCTEGIEDNKGIAAG